MNKQKYEQALIANYSKIAGEVVTVDVKDTDVYIFCSELGMYRIADKYPPVSKGYSKNLNTWFVCCKHRL